jgi:hypothetical protein
MADEINSADNLKELAKALNPRQLLFCKLFVTDAELIGNGCKSYCKAYGLDYSDPKENRTARSNAYDLLTKPYIMAYVDALLEEGGLNDQNIEKQLLFVATQNADFGAKMTAIKEYNALRGRIKDKGLAISKVVITLGGEDDDNDNGNTTKDTETTPTV